MSREHNMVDSYWGVSYCSCCGVGYTSPAYTEPCPGPIGEKEEKKEKEDNFLDRALSESAFDRMERIFKSKKGGI